MSDITVTFPQYTTDTTLNGPYDAGDTVTLADSSTILDALTDSDIDALATNNVDIISATDSVLSWSADQFTHLIAGPVTIDPGTVATLADTGAHIAAFSTTQIDALAAAGLDVVDATDDTLTLSVAQFDKFVADNIALTAGDSVTISDTAANLGTLTYSALAGDNVDFLNATNTISITVQNFNDLGTVRFTPGSTVTISDTAANLGTLTYSALAGDNIDFLNATTAISVTVQNITDLGTVHFTAPSSVTLADTGANIAAIPSLSTLGTHGVDTVNATDDVLSINISQLAALGAVTLTQADTVTLADTQTNIQNLSGASFNTDINKGIDIFHSTSGVLTVSTSQLGQMIHNGGGGVFVPRAHFQASDVVTWASTGSDIASGGNIGSVLQSAIQSGVDIVHATDGALTLLAEQFLDVVLNGAHFTVSDNLTIADSDDDLQALWSTAGLNSLLSASGVNTITTDGDTTHVTAAGVVGVEGSGAVFSTDDTTILSDTGANIATLTTDQLTGLTAINVGSIEATDTLSLSLSQYEAIVGTIPFSGVDGITVTGNLDALSTGEIAGFASNNVTHLVDVDGFNEVIWTVAQWGALTTAVTIDNGNQSPNSNYVFDSAANLNDVTATQVANFVTEGGEVWGVSPFLDSSLVTWDMARLDAMGASAFSGPSNTLISDTAAHIEAVSDFSIFAAHGIDEISASDGALSLSVAQALGLGSTTVDSNDTLTLADSLSVRVNDGVEWSSWQSFTVTTHG